MSVCAVTLESLDLELHFWHTGTSSGYLGEVRISRSSGQGQGHRSKNGHTRVTKYTLSQAIITTKHFLKVLITSTMVQLLTTTNRPFTVAVNSQ